MVGDNSNTEVVQVKKKRKSRVYPEHMIGKTFGDDNQIVVTGSVRGGNTKKYIVHCSKCAEDPELFGDGTFYSAKSSLLAGNLPCGCSLSPRLSKVQHEILVGRLCKTKDYTFIGFSGEWVGIRSRVDIKCNKDGNEWNVNLSKLISDKKSCTTGCPECGRRIVDVSRLISDEGLKALRLRG
jgi:hypothetical protein